MCRFVAQQTATGFSRTGCSCFEGNSCNKSNRRQSDGANADQRSRKKPHHYDECPICLSIRFANDYQFMSHSWIIDVAFTQVLQPHRRYNRI